MEVKFLTAEPLVIFDGMTITFSHEPGGPDFSRVEAGQAKFLADHIPYVDYILGSINRAWHDAEASYADVDFSSYEDATIDKYRHLFQEEDFKGLSAGMTEMSNIRETAPGQYFVGNWQLGEISATPMPRDVSTEVVSLSVDPKTLTTLSQATPACILNLGLGKAHLNEAAKALFQAARDPKFHSEIADKREESAMERLMTEEEMDRIADKLAERLAEKDADTEETEEDAQDAEGQENAQESAQDAPEKDAVADAQENSVNPRIAEMTRLAAAQEGKYDREKLLDLQIEAVARDLSATEYQKKLKSIQIQTNPTAPRDSKEQPYNLTAALQMVMTGAQNLAPYERSVSDEIYRHQTDTLGMSTPNALGIPMAEVDRLLTLPYQQATGLGNTPALNSDAQSVFRRVDTPDPLNLLPLVTRFPSGPGGSPRLLSITAPDARSVTEPDNDGFDIGTDISVAEEQVSPKILMHHEALTNLGTRLTPRLLTEATAILLAKLREMQNQLILMGTGTTEPTGLYNLSGVVSTANLTSPAGVTAAVVNDGLARCYNRLDGRDVRIVVNPDTASQLLSVPNPPGVAAFYDGQAIRGIPVVQTRAMEGAGNDKTARGVIGPFSEVFLKEWDNAVFVSAYQQAGVRYLTMELYWDTIVGRETQFTRFRED